MGRFRSRAGGTSSEAQQELPRAGGNQSKGQECSQGFWASSRYCAKGMAVLKEGECGQRES